MIFLRFTASEKVSGKPYTKVGFLTLVQIISANWDSNLQIETIALILLSLMLP
jgi:hypothetical protein